MYVQIDNTNFANKGAELMLCSIMDRVNEVYKDTRFVYGMGKSDGELIRKKGLFVIANLTRFKLPLHKLYPQNYLNRIALAKKESVNVILDAGGFQFSDQFSRLHHRLDNRMLAKYYSDYKKRFTKIIFLPQAFGPFTLPYSQERIDIVYKYADLIFARDDQSFSFLVDRFGASSKLKIAPDFTNLIEPKICMDLYQKTNGAICVIPNSKMITHASSEVSEKYISFIASLINYFHQERIKVFILNHEGENDNKLIVKINQHLHRQVMVIENLNALQVKGVIRNVKLLISSRFHGVASGLNQGIPTLCTSWSHKYNEILKLYNCETSLLNVLQPFNPNILQHLDKFKSSQERIDEVKMQTLNMWDDVFSIINDN